MVTVTIPQAVSAVATSDEHLKDIADAFSVTIPQAVSAVATGVALVKDSNGRLLSLLQYRKR